MVLRRDESNEAKTCWQTEFKSETDCIARFVYAIPRVFGETDGAKSTGTGLRGDIQSVAGVFFASAEWPLRLKAGKAGAGTLDKCHK